MNKVFLDEDEWYPVYTVNKEKTNFNETVELTDKELKEFLEVYNKFYDWQKRLKKMVRGV